MNEVRSRYATALSHAHGHDGVHEDDTGENGRHENDPDHRLNAGFVRGV